jgi:hypothetical protein
VTEALTERNVPCGFCCICLESFDDGGSLPGPVVKTNCFHHLHDSCLRRYVAATAKMIREEEDEWTKLNPYGHRAVARKQVRLQKFPR